MAPRLIVLLGPSGSGKDSLLAHARQALAGEHGVVFAHRYITRPAHAGGENHVALTREEFIARRRQRLFALDWQSHGLCYGVGIELDLWLARGLTVVLNGSRQHLGPAQARYPALLPVWVEVSAHTLRQRLIARGREDDEAIAQRLAHHPHLPPMPHPGLTIDNNGPLAQAGERLVALIRQR